MNNSSNAGVFLILPAIEQVARTNIVLISILHHADPTYPT